MTGFPRISGTREEYVEQGRLAAELESASRGETGISAKQRSAQAMAYAAWWFDGRPNDSHAAYAQEFGLADMDVLDSLLRPAAAPREPRK